MMSQLTSAQAVTATPFSGEEAAFESEVVRAECGTGLPRPAAGVRLL